MFARVELQQKMVFARLLEELAEAEENAYESSRAEAC
jgi:hypothetical protein